ERWIVLRWRVHLPGTNRAGVAGQIEVVAIEPPRGDVVHPRHAAEGDIERFAAIGGAVLEDDDAVGCEPIHAGESLVAHEDAAPRGQIDAQVLADDVKLDLWHETSLPGKARLVEVRDARGETTQSDLAKLIEHGGSRRVDLAAHDRERS